MKPFCLCIRTQLLSSVQLSATPWTVAHQTPLSMGFSRQVYWSWLPCSPPGDLPNPGIKPEALTSPALAVGSLPLVPPGKPETILFDPIMMDTYHRIFCKTHRMCSIKSKLQYKLWAIMMCHCGVIDCNKYTTLVRDVSQCWNTRTIFEGLPLELSSRFKEVTATFGWIHSSWRRQSTTPALMHCDGGSLECLQCAAVYSRCFTVLSHLPTQ